MYGAIAQARRNFTEAEADYNKELAAHPDNAGTVAALADVGDKSGDSARARRTLQRFLSVHPE